VRLPLALPLQYPISPLRALAGGKDDDLRDDPPHQLGRGNDVIDEDQVEGALGTWRTAEPGSGHADA